MVLACLEGVDGEPAVACCIFLCTLVRRIVCVSSDCGDDNGSATIITARGRRGMEQAIHVPLLLHFVLFSCSLLFHVLSLSRRRLSHFVFLT